MSCPKVQEILQEGGWKASRTLSTINGRVSTRYSKPLSRPKEDTCQVQVLVYVYVCGTFSSDCIHFYNLLGHQLRLCLV